MKKISKIFFYSFLLFTLSGCNTNQIITSQSQEISPQNPYITLTNLPEVESVQNIQLEKSNNLNSGKKLPDLSMDEFKQIISTAKVISKDDMRLSIQWSNTFDVWYTGSFTTKDGIYKFELGYNPEPLGILTLPNGNIGAFSFDVSKNFTLEKMKIIDLIKEQYPKFKDFPRNTFAGGIIKAQKSADLWSVVFITFGSGVPVIGSDCFMVEGNTVTEIKENNQQKTAKEKLIYDECSKLTEDERGQY